MVLLAFCKVYNGRMKKNYDLTIIGAGASGMMAAIKASKRGKRVLMIERNAKPGKKILLTGNGRCNISNENSLEDQKKPVHYHGKNPKFVLSVFNKFGLQETKKFFQDVGIEFIEEDEGRLFPASNQAGSVVEVLEYAMNQEKVRVMYNQRVKKMVFEDSIYKIVLQDGREIQSQNVLISTGGKSLSRPAEDGYEFASQFGHKIIDMFPAYSGLNTKSQLCHKLQGVKMEVEVKAIVGNKEIAKNTGTIMFAHYGLSAPVVLEISREIAEARIVNGHKAFVEVNFFPNIAENELDAMILKRWEKFPQKSLDFSFVGLLPKKVFPAILAVEGIDGTVKVSDVNKALRRKIVNLLGKYRFEIDSVRGYNEAHFTAGGVDTKEIDPQTMQSKLQKGLYFSGEILDIDGDCGGYNLQWAWSSGAVVGMAV